MASKYRNTGQTCVCANRLLVHDRVYDGFVARLAQAVSALKVGAGTEAGVQQGPLINEAAAAKVEQLIADATAKGARVVLGGKRHPLGGTFFEPTILADVTPAMACVQEEIFGPVAPLIRFSAEAEAVALANDTPTGSPPTSTVVTSAASGGWRMRSNTGSLASTKVSSPPRWRPSAA